jgi:hypothetical protein
VRIINIITRIGPGAFRQESATQSATNHICGTLWAIPLLVVKQLSFSANVITLESGSELRPVLAMVFNKPERNQGLNVKS